MSDHDLIRRGDALAAAEENRAFGPASIINALRALPATDRIEALTAKVKLMDDLDAINGEKIEALEARLGYYNLLWQTYEGKCPVEHLEEAVKNHSAVSDRLAEKLHEKELLLEKSVELLESALRYNSAMHSGAGAYNKRIKDLIAEIKGENK